MEEIREKTRKELKNEFLEEQKSRTLEIKYKESEKIRKRIKEIRDH